MTPLERLNAPSSSDEEEEVSNGENEDHSSKPAATRKPEPPPKKPAHASAKPSGIKQKSIWDLTTEEESDNLFSSSTDDNENGVRPTFHSAIPYAV